MSGKVNPGWKVDKISGFDGWNSTGTTKFQDNYLKNLIRECFQNSLDAKVEESNEPVKVRIEKLYYNLKDIIPNFKEYEQHVIKACKEAQKDNPATQADAKKALNFLEEYKSKKVPVIRIRDFNTVGLEGVKKDRERFDFLIKRSGSSIWQGMAIGGSFGLGKFAPFTMSPLRTIAYSTLNKNGTYGFAMKAILQSYYSSDRSVNSGTWFYWDKSDNKGITDTNVIKNLGMLREEQGTDIYIIGFDDDEGFISGENNFSLDVIREVAENYFLAIKENHLVCEVFDGKDTEIIDSISIDKYLKRNYVLFSKKDNGGYSKSPMRYSACTGDLFMQAYNCSPEHKYKLNIKHVGVVDLFLKIKPKNFEGKSMKMNHILRSRKLLMKVDAASFPSISSDPFSGVMIVREDKGNELLVQAETARHDKWDHTEVRDNKAKKKVKEALDDFRLKLEEIFQKLAANRRGLREFPDSRFLPFSSTNLEGEDEESTLATKYEKSKTTKIKPSKVKPTKKPIIILTPGEGGSGSGTGGGSGGGGTGPNEGTGTGGSGDGKDELEKFIKRYRATSIGQSEYNILIDIEEKLEGINGKIYARSEDKLKEMPLEVLEAKSTSGNTFNIKNTIEDGLKSSIIDLGLLKKGKNSFKIKIKNKRKLALELKLEGEIDE